MTSEAGLRNHARSALKKTVCSGCGKTCRSLYDKRWRRARDLGCGGREVYLDFEMRRVKCKTCGVKNEKLDFLSDNTKLHATLCDADRGDVPGDDDQRRGAAHAA